MPMSMPTPRREPDTAHLLPPGLNRARGKPYDAACPLRRAAAATARRRVCNGGRRSLPQGLHHHRSGSDSMIAARIELVMAPDPIDVPATRSDSARADAVPLDRSLARSGWRMRRRSVCPSSRSPGLPSPLHAGAARAAAAIGSRAREPTHAHGARSVWRHTHARRSVGRPRSAASRCTGAPVRRARPTVPRPRRRATAGSAPSRAGHRRCGASTRGPAGAHHAAADCRRGRLPSRPLSLQQHGYGPW